MANPFAVKVPNPLEALMLGEQAFDKGRQGYARSEAASLAGGGDYRGALARLMGANDFQGAALLNNMYQQSPENIAQVERAKAQVQHEFAPKTTNIKLPSGEEVTVERGPNGYVLPQIHGMPAQPTMPVPPGVDPKAYREARSKQIANIDDKAILDADKAVQAGLVVKRDLSRAIELNKTAYSGPFAKERGYISSQFSGARGVDTEELTNVVTNQALENLRAVFGGNPTEGERKILLDVQGAASQAPEVRERIYSRAMEAAELRTEFNKKNADAMRRGTYLLPSDQRGFADAKPQPAGQSAIPTQDHMNALKQNPQMAAEYDRKFGPGSAAKVLGQ